MGLTAKQESAAQLHAAGSTQVAAYRQSYNVSPTATNHSVHVDATRLFANPAMSLRIQQLRTVDESALAERRAWTLDRLVDAAEQNLAGARESKQWGSANGAVEWIGRATGLVSDKVQPGAVAVTKIIINLAPGVEPPVDIVEATEYHEVEDSLDTPEVMGVDPVRH